MSSTHEALADTDMCGAARFPRLKVIVSHATGQETLPYRDAEECLWMINGDIRLCQRIVEHARGLVKTSLNIQESAPLESRAVFASAWYAHLVLERVIPDANTAIPTHLEYIQSAMGADGADAEAIAAAVDGVRESFASVIGAFNALNGELSEHQPRLYPAPTLTEGIAGVPVIGSHVVSEGEIENNQLHSGLYVDPDLAVGRVWSVGRLSLICCTKDCPRHSSRSYHLHLVYMPECLPVNDSKLLFDEVVYSNLGQFMFAAQCLFSLDVVYADIDLELLNRHVAVPFHQLYISLSTALRYTFRYSLSTMVAPSHFLIVMESIWLVLRKLSESQCIIAHGTRNQTGICKWIQQNLNTVPDLAYILHMIPEIKAVSNIDAFVVKAPTIFSERFGPLVVDQWATNLIALSLQHCSPGFDHAKFETMFMKLYVIDVSKFWRIAMNNGRVRVYFLAHYDDPEPPIDRRMMYPGRFKAFGLHSFYKYSRARDYAM